MDILAVLFLIFGWIFRVKGLVIAAIALASFITVWQVVISVMKGKKSNPDSEYDSKSEFKDQFIIVFDFILLALAIIKLCIW